MDNYASFTSVPAPFVITCIFSFQVLSEHIIGGVLLQPPSVDDVDQREMFCMYLLPGSQQNRKVGIVFV